MIVRRFLIAGGNSTALVSGCAEAERQALARTLLDRVEQVGFIDEAGSWPRIRMMGGEFCINATLAFASTLGTSGTLTASGVRHTVSFANAAGETAISLPLRWSRRENVILLEGIGFVLLAKSDTPAMGKEELSALCRNYALPAFGAILFDNDAITPYVHVAAVDSFVRETACGSGSVALHLFNGAVQVKQPTGRVITVTSQGNIFSIAARVSPMD